MMASKIRVLLKENGKSVYWLAKQRKTSAQNYYNKLSRDNFTERELREIAAVFDIKLEISFIRADGTRI